MKLLKSHYVALILAIVAGVLEYLNQQTFAFKAPWDEVFKYGVFMISAFGITAAVGNQLGIAIQNLLHFSHATMVAIATGAYVLAGAVATFSMGGVAKGIILGVTAFILSIFGTPPNLPPVPVQPAPAEPAA